jgi:hypothetical protein
VGSPEANVMRAGARHRKFAGGLPSGLYAALSVEETGEALQIPKETVKTRLLRARRRLQKELDPEVREALHDTFPFAGRGCDALTERVIAKFIAAAKS